MHDKLLKHPDSNLHTKQKQIENDLIWAAKQDMQLLLRRLSSKSEIQKVKNGPFHRLLAQIYTHTQKSQVATKRNTSFKF